MDLDQLLEKYKAQDYFFCFDSFSLVTHGFAFTC